MDFLTTYLHRGFGSMNKNDVEVWVFNQLLNEPKTKHLSDYEFSIMLQIPQTKVKRLRYEAGLVYQTKSAEEYNNEFLILLQNAKVKPTNSEFIQFAMEDKGLYLYVDNILKKGGRFSDRSYNNEIMQISRNDLVYLLENCLIPKEEQEEIKNKYKKVTNQDISFMEIIKKVVEKFADGFSEELGYVAARSLWVFTKNNILEVIQQNFLNP